MNSCTHTKITDVSLDGSDMTDNVAMAAQEKNWEWEKKNNNERYLAVTNKT